MAVSKAVLIVGGSGFLGSNLALRLREKYRVFATFHSHPTQIPGVTYVPSRLEGKEWVKRLIYSIKPEVIIYAAGDHNLESAERDAPRAEAMYAGGAAAVSNVSELMHSRFIYISSCYTYDGQRGNYKESDIALPWCVLGKSKISGENYIRGKCLNYIVVRSSPIFGFGQGVTPNLIDTIRDSLSKKQKIILQNHELHSYASIVGFGDMIEKLVESGIRNKVFHYGGLTKLTQYELGKKFAEHFGFDPNLVQPEPKKQRKSGTTLIDEPIMDYSLNCSVAVDQLKIEPLLIEQSLELLEKNLILTSMGSGLTR